MKIVKKLGTLGMAALAIMAGASTLMGADASTQGLRGQLAESDYKFVKDTARGGTTEVQLGELAKQKAVSPAVRGFGERMVADHSKANEELQQIVTRKGATPPTSLSHKENSELERLQKLSGKDFDKAYANLMVTDHKKDVKEFQDAARDLKDSDLRAFAQKTLGTLEQHYGMAKQMQETVKNER
jgi:putative membrane protein